MPQYVEGVLIQYPGETDGWARIKDRSPVRLPADGYRITRELGGSAELAHSPIQPDFGYLGHDVPPPQRLRMVLGEQGGHKVAHAWGLLPDPNWNELLLPKARPDLYGGGTVTYASDSGAGWVVTLGILEGLAVLPDSSARFWLNVRVNGTTRDSRADHADEVPRVYQYGLLLQGAVYNHIPQDGLRLWSVQGDSVKRFEFTTN